MQAEIEGEKHIEALGDVGHLSEKAKALEVYYRLMLDQKFTKSELETWDLGDFRAIVHFARMKADESAAESMLMKQQFETKKAQT